MCKLNLANNANFDFHYTITATSNIKPCSPFNPFLLEGHEIPVLLLLTLKRKICPCSLNSTPSLLRVFVSWWVGDEGGVIGRENRVCWIVLTQHECAS